MQQKKLVATSSSQSRIGLTTSTFKNFIKNEEITLEEIIEWSRQIGFSLIEIRDSQMMMSHEYLLQLKERANHLNVQLHYAWDAIDLLAPDDQLFYNAIEKACILGKNGYARVLIAHEHIRDEPVKKGYTQGEVEKIVPVMRRYIEYAKMKGITLCFENSFEPLQGDGYTYSGMSELLSRVKDMMTTFDPGNFTNQQQVRVVPTSSSILEYVRTFKRQIPYFHIKTTLRHHLLPYIDFTDDFDLNILMKELANVAVICLELPSDETLKKTKENFRRSIGFLIEREMVKLR